ncbi:MAG: hypothetical protein SV062_13825, partial [Thermodesulfobacteriota bacterium]|nr:hypothetical protein [Thermodesulfobacteriota bacterium]
MVTLKILEELGLDQPSGENIRFGKLSRKEEFEKNRKKYPHVPLTFLLKIDCVRRGVSFTKEAIEKFQDPYFEHSPHIMFQWYGYDFTEPYGVPQSYYFNDGTVVGTVLSPPDKDPYIIDLDEKNNFIIRSDGEILEEVNFFKRPAYYGKKTRKNRVM